MVLSKEREIKKHDKQKHFKRNQQKTHTKK